MHSMNYIHCFSTQPSINRRWVFASLGVAKLSPLSGREMKNSRLKHRHLLYGVRLYGHSGASFLLRVHSRMKICYVSVLSVVVSLSLFLSKSFDRSESKLAIDCSFWEAASTAATVHLTKNNMTSIPTLPHTATTTSTTTTMMMMMIEIDRMISQVLMWTLYL